MRPAIAHEPHNHTTVVCWRCGTREGAYNDDWNNEYTKDEHLDHLLSEHDHNYSFEKSGEPEFWFQILAPEYELGGEDTAHGIRVLILDAIERYAKGKPIDVNIATPTEGWKDRPEAEAEYQAVPGEDGWTLIRMAARPEDFQPLQVGK